MTSWRAIKDGMPGPGSPLSRLALWAIRQYQRHLSPIKGFSCAYRGATGGASCSAFAYRAIERHGLVTGLALLDRRLLRCAETHRKLKYLPNPRLHYQRGECDCGDLPCDACSVDIGDCRQCRTCSSDTWRNWREKRWLAKADRLRREHAERERRERFERERQERSGKR